ncbi:MAG: ATP-binding SpoIIE family protein phosphatase [Synechococcales bacterium]|nr:ATP-binding SpoIIE family protein phosphatase [Synechococcales bacterium]
MAKTTPRRIQVSHTSDRIIACHAVREMALSLGFPTMTCEELVLVVSELATNLIQHAQQGTLVLEAIAQANRQGIQIESIDQGPGIPDVELAITDGFSTSSSLGNGLGTINRLMDEFHIVSKTVENPGTHITCRRWLRSHQPLGDCPLEFGVATRPYPGLSLNGDAFVIKRWEQSALVAMIDGLGHGQYAHRAARTAQDYINRHYDQSMVEIFRGVGRACRATRGVVMAIARFDYYQNKLTFANVGNIEVRLIGSPTPVRFLIRRGIIGNNAPSPSVTEHLWRPPYILVLHTDGLMTHWQWERFPQLVGASATRTAQELLRALAKDNDDATVVVVKGVVP